MDVTLEAPQHPSSVIHQGHMKDAVDGSVVPSPNDERVRPSDAPSLGGVMDDGLKDGSPAVISSASLLVLCQGRIGEDVEQRRYWGRHVRAGAVTQIVGETSAGKTTFLHRFGYRLALGEEFLGIKPPRPLRVLHLDFETDEEIYVEHLTAIGTAPGWDFLALDAVDDLPRGLKLVKYLHERIRENRYDIVIVDALMEAYPVDENDNDAAQKQILAFRKLARTTGVAIVLVHNAGLRTERKTTGGKERVAESKFLGRGATARSDRADVVINFTVPTPKERLLTVVKARGGDLGAQIRLRFAGVLDYEIVTSTGTSQGVVATMQAKVLAFAREETAAGRAWIERHRFMERLGIAKDTAAELALDRALGASVKAGTLQRPRDADGKEEKGVYVLGPTPRPGEGARAIEPIRDNLSQAPGTLAEPALTLSDMEDDQR